jgi:hypothetical protein
MKVLIGLAAFAAVAQASAGNRNCKNGAVPKKSFLENAVTGKADQPVPGTGMDLEKLKPFEKSHKDGYFHVSCMNEGMRFDADKHSMQGSKRYAAQNIEVSIIWYNQLVPKEDRKEMTPGVCFNYCRSFEGFNYFGLLNGRECYCMPYYKAKAGGEDQGCDAPCDGDNTQMCGGKDKSDIYEMHYCNDTGEDLFQTLSDLRVFHSELKNYGSNLGTCAELKQYIGQMTQTYSGQAGDLVAGHQAQGVKESAGKNLVGAKAAVKMYAKIDKVMKKIQDLMTTGKFADNAADAREADELIKQSQYLLTEAKPITKATETAFEGCAGFLGTKHGERVDQYNPIVEYAKKFKYDNETSYDSMCSGKTVLGTFSGTVGDCAYRCDNTLHPKKCTAFQLHNIVSPEAPKSSEPKLEWDSPAGTYAAKNGMNIDVTPNGKRGISDVTAEGPIKFNINPPANGKIWVSHMTGKAKIYVSATFEGGKLTDMSGHTPPAGIAIGASTGDFAAVEYELDTGRNLLWVDTHADNTDNWSLTFSGEATTEEGICTLYEDIDTMSYYTCPDDAEGHGDGQGKNAGCYLKVSEAKGFELHKDHEHINERCLVTDKLKDAIPDIREFDWSDMVSKVRGI